MGEFDLIFDYEVGKSVIWPLPAKNVEQAKKMAEKALHKFPTSATHIRVLDTYGDLLWISEVTEGNNLFDEQLQELLAN